MEGYNTKNYTEQGGETTHIGGALIIEEGANVEGLPERGSGEYELPVASNSVLGGVKVGEGLLITEDGVLSAEAGETYTLPVAGSSKLGGIKIGNGLSITEDGKMSITDPLNVEMIRIMVSGTTENNNVDVSLPSGIQRSDLKLKTEGNLNNYCFVYYENGIACGTEMGIGDDDRAYFHAYSDMDGAAPKEYIFGIACVDTDPPEDIVFVRSLPQL